MSTAVTVVGVVAFVAGLLASFLRDRLRGRLAGFGAMAGGALLVLVAGAPSAPGAWWMAGTGAMTLGGLLVFGAALGRWTAGATGRDAGRLDDDG